MKNYIHVFLINFLLISLILPQNILSFDYSGGDSLKINLSNTDEIGGFQLEFDGVDILSADGGSATDAGFFLSVSGSTVLGFSLTGASISPGEGHMTTLFFNSDSIIDGELPCFKLGNNPDQANLPYCQLSDTIGNEINVELGECADGCFNSSACNFLTDDECILPTNYYQDADEDGLGNPDVSQSSCEDVDGYVTNNSDDDDTCEGIISELDGSCCISGIFDECGVCNGDGPIENFDCDGNCSVNLDCLGNCGGSAVLDDCGDCNGNNSAKDACGNCEGDCIEDTSGTIVCSSTENVPENLEVADCNGICGGDDISCIDCAGNIGGQIEVDCNGVCGGTAYVDSCDSCVGGNTGTSQCLSLYDNMPNDFSITSTYPNPFNPSINIEYSVPSVGFVNLQVIGLDGKHVNTITNSIQTKGEYNVQWTPENVPSGMYLVQLNANNQIQNKKIVYLK